MVSFVDSFDACVPTGGCESPVDVEPCEPDVEPSEPDVESVESGVESEVELDSDFDEESDDEPDVESDVELDSDFDEESDADGEDVEPESDGSASATPGVFAIAAPTPSATASAPTRPMYFAVPIMISSPVGGDADGPSSSTDESLCVLIDHWLPVWRGGAFVSFDPGVSRPPFYPRYLT